MVARAPAPAYDAGVSSNPWPGDGTRQAGGLEPPWSMPPWSMPPSRSLPPGTPGAIAASYRPLLTLAGLPRVLFALFREVIFVGLRR